MKLLTLSLLRKQLMFSSQTIWKIQRFLSQLRDTKFMLIIELAGNTTIMNVASLNILLRGQLLRSSLIQNLVLMTAKMF